MRLKQLRRGADYLASLIGYLPLSFKYRKFTMIRHLRFIDNLALANSLAFRNPALAAGAVVECGTWRGGMAAALVEVGGPNRTYCFLDSFQGLPPAGDLDGDAAKTWQADTSAPGYYDNCAATIEDFRSVIRMAAATSDTVRIVPGFFEDSFKTFAPPPIAVLRLDVDWYESTKQCLEHLWQHVLPGGLIVLDDYYAWSGCALAVHEFLAATKATERIRQSPVGRIAFLVKA